MNRSLILPGLAVIAFSFMGYHLLQTNRAAPMADPPVQPSRSPYQDTIAGSGLVEPKSENIHVAAPLSGTVAEVLVRPGQLVAAGDLLFRIDDRQQAAELSVQKSRLAQAQANLNRLQKLPRPEDIPPSEALVARATAELKARQDDLNRSEELVARKVTTQQEQIQAEQAFAIARAQLEQAQAEHAKLLAGAWEEELEVARTEVAAAREQMRQAEVEVERLRITAPVSGTILKVDVRPGEFVGTPPGEPLIVMGDNTELHVRVDIDEQDLPRFRPGLPGKGFVRGDAANSLPMRFVRVEPYVEPKRSLTNSGTERVDTRVLQVIYALEPAEQPVYVGQQLDVFLDSKAVYPAAAVPQ